MFSAIRSGDYYMFDELDDDLLEEKDEMSSDEEGGKHDGERRVTLSKVNSFLMVWLKTESLSVEPELCELICISGLQTLSVVGTLTAGIRIFDSSSKITSVNCLCVHLFIFNISV